MSRMISPVRCNHCHRVYDLCDGEPVARYADCTVYITPCCGLKVDDRKWLSSPAFRELTAAEADAVKSGRPYVMGKNGRMELIGVKR